jgi:hypothetical protein
VGHNGILLTENHNEIYTHFTCGRRAVSFEWMRAQAAVFLLSTAA